MQFNRATRVALVILSVAGPARPAAAQCPAARGPRAAVIGVTYAGAEVAALAIRHADWWHPPRQAFHVVWGGSPSKGQDALLHMTITYQAAQAARLAWQWACVTEPAAAWLGAATGFALGLPKEIGDGLHQNGFSGTDMTFTALGALLPALHQSWPPARALQLKAFYWPSREYRTKTGQFPELENDYAGQRYFLTVNPARAGAATPLPWLGLALGHSVPTWASVPPVHEWFLTLDVDLRALPVKARWWRAIAGVVDQVHIPLPGVRIVGGQTAVGAY